MTAGLMTVGARAFLAAAEGTWAIPAPLASRKESSRAIHRAGVGRGILGQARRPPQRHKCRSLDKSGTYAPTHDAYGILSLVAPLFYRKFIFIS